MHLREKIRSAHCEEETGVQRKHVAEAALGDRDRRADDRADQRRKRVGPEPSQRLPAVLALEGTKLTVFIPSAKS